MNWANHIQSPLPIEESLPGGGGVLLFEHALASGLGIFDGTLHLLSFEQETLRASAQNEVVNRNLREKDAHED